MRPPSDPQSTPTSPPAGTSAGFVDHFVPPAIRRGEEGPDALRRARLTVATAFIALGAALFGLAYSFATGLTAPRGILTFTALLLAAAPWLLRRSGSIPLAANAICAALFTAVVVISVADRGVETPLLVITIPVCLIAALLAGRSWAIFWAALSLLAIWSLYAAWRLGVPFVPLRPAAGQVLNATIVLSTLIGVVTAIAFFYETYKSRTITELKELTNRLERARRNAERANASKSQFLASVSHEIRTPMNGVLTVAELLAATELDPEQREFVETIRHSARALLKLVDEILDLRRCELGALQLESVPFRPAEVLREAAAAVRAQARHKGLGFDVVFDGDPHRWLLGDPTRLRQVLINLLGNAVKFTHTGEVAITCRCQPLDPERAALHYTVRDTGVGIDPARLPHVFEVFEQERPSTARRFGGSGLGLAICRQLIEHMGGQIAVESTPGKGSCFTVRLTLPITAPPTAGTERPTEVRSHEEPKPLAGRVLLAEDNPVNRRVATLLLERLGLEVEWAQDGNQVLQRTAERRYDLVLMDCQMPQLDGYEATRRIRAREAGRDDGVRLPIVAITASAMAADRERCLACGMDDHVTKPIDPATLHRVLARFLSPTTQSCTNRGS